MHAYAGEPDLDRVIRMQAPPVDWAYGPAVGVKVVEIWREGQNRPDKRLLPEHVGFVVMQAAQRDVTLAALVDTLSPRGRIKGDVVEQYQAAGN